MPSSAILLRSAAELLDEDQAALRLAAAGDAALCTIVGIEGSFSRRLGAQLAIARDGTMAGSLSDGCLERELAAQAATAGGAGRPILLRYGRGSPFIDFRLPCGSGLDILIDPTPDRTAMIRAVAKLDRREPANLSLPLAPAHLLRERKYLPALQLLVLGAGFEADWLSRVAASYGVPGSFVGPGQGISLGREPETLTADCWTAIILLFHDHEWEGPLLEWALRTPAFYIGALGGATTREQRLETLKAKGHAASEIARIRSPIGLIPQARDARTLALSILADTVAGYEALREEGDGSLGREITMIAPERVALVLLAAGRSRRFEGGDKLAEPLLDKPLARHVVTALEKIAFLARIAVVSATAVDFAALGYRTVVNDDPSLGQGRSLALGVKAAADAGADAVLVALADMPRVTAAHITRILDAADGPEAIVASSDGVQPRPPALFGRAQFSALLRIDGDRGARELIRRGHHIITSPAELVDIDTREDLRDLRTKLGESGL